MQQATTILIAALGGEGGGVLAEWLVATATLAGYAAQSTSIPGVAQRTGATTYYIEIYPVPVVQLQSRVPVLSLLPVPGCIDLLVSSELMETARTVQAGMASAERTTLLTSTGRTLTTVEKMGPGDGRFDSERLLAVARQNSRRLVAFDMDTMARGTMVSAVMLGAIAASGVLPLAREQFEAVIRSAGVGVEASLLGFTRAWNEINAGAAGKARRAEPQQTIESACAGGPVDRFPEPTRDILDIGYRRLAEYQDAAYARLYLERLERVLAAERRIDAAGTGEFALTRETGRFLALWMAFDDIVRVADLKSRASRFARVRGEVAVRDGDIVRIYDFFKPGIAEFCALLPSGVAQLLLNWDSRRQARGKPAFAVALRVPAHGVIGFAILRTLAGLRKLRRLGSRYTEEQALIVNWLEAIERGAAESWTLGYEIALCGRLIKGYGATNERGKANLKHMIGQLAAGATFATPAERAAAIRKAREAALVDEGGRAMDQVLVEHGAMPRPVMAQPIRWSSRSRARNAGRPAA
jgi:indolepyruvate ferredoxin oxidoreductase, beta subunit